MTQKYQKGGWVKCIAPAKIAKEMYYNQFVVGEYYQIKDVFSKFVETVEGHRMFIEKHGDNDKECDWVGMEKPSTHTSKRADTSLKPWEVEAIGKFPIGTRFKCAIRGKEYTVKNHIFNTSFDHIISFEDCDGYIRFGGTWAEKIEEKWEPKVGEYALMIAAGGWGYSPKNNGCVAVITKTGTRVIDGIPVPYISGRVINPIDCEYTIFSEVPIHSSNEIICRKALSHEIPEQETNSIEYVPQKGDWIVPVTPEGTPGCRLKRGKAYEVVSVTINFCVTKEFGGDIYFKDLRKARPDEIPTNKEEEWKPKTGDWVEVLQCVPGQNWCLDMNKYVGKVFQIKEELESDTYLLRGVENWVWNYKRNPHFKKASKPVPEPEEHLPTFNTHTRPTEHSVGYMPGDTVLLSGDAYGWGAAREIANNKVVRILSITGKYVEFINSDGQTGTTILTEIVKKTHPIMMGTETTIKKHNVEKLPSKIIVKRKEKVGKRFILS